MVRQRWALLSGISPWASIESGEYELADTPEAAAPLPRRLLRRPSRCSGSGRPRPKSPTTRRRQPEKVRRRRGRKRPPASSANSSDQAAKAKPRSKVKKQPPVAEGAEKKVLIEETPALDTYEARQRARLVLGGLVAACFLIFFWIVYSVFLSDSNPVEMAAEDSGADLRPGAAQARCRRRGSRHAEPGAGQRQGRQHQGSRQVAGKRDQGLQRNQDGNPGQGGARSTQAGPAPVPGPAYRQGRDPGSTGARAKAGPPRWSWSSPGQPRATLPSLCPPTPPS